jgi:hypothetical protein
MHIGIQANEQGDAGVQQYGKYNAPMLRCGKKLRRHKYIFARDITVSDRLSYRLLVLINPRLRL